MSLKKNSSNNFRSKDKINHSAHEIAYKLMTSKVPTIYLDKKVKDVFTLLRSKKKEFDSIIYIYVLMKNGALYGMISIRELFLFSSDDNLRKIIKRKNIFSVRPYADQEKVLRLALKTGLKSVPVLDKKKKFLGAVTYRSLLHIMEEEHVEDILLSAGIQGKKENLSDSFMKISAFGQFRKRVPWLIFGILGGIVTAFVVHMFEEPLKAEIILASFIPLVVYIADAVGAQTQTIFIRSLVLNKNLSMLKYVFKEGIVTFSLAVFLGLFISLITFMWQGSEVLAIVIGTSVLATIIISSFVAILLPWFFNKINYDPAVASGPFATVIRDITSLMVYFAIANLLYFQVLVG